MYEYNAKVLNVVDGDTYDLDIDLGFHIHIHERVRVLDLDTPETRGDERDLGETVKAFVADFLTGKEVVIRSKREILPKTDSFGRWLVEVIVADESVAEMLTDLGVNKYADSYDVSSVLALKEVIGG